MGEGSSFWTFWYNSDYLLLVFRVIAKNFGAGQGVFLAFLRFGFVHFFCWRFFENIFNSCVLFSAILGHILAIVEGFIFAVVGQFSLLCLGKFRYFTVTFLAFLSADLSHFFWFGNLRFWGLLEKVKNS